MTFIADLYNGTSRWVQAIEKIRDFQVFEDGFLVGHLAAKWDWYLWTYWSFSVVVLWDMKIPPGNFNVFLGELVSPTQTSFWWCCFSIKPWVWCSQKKWASGPEGFWLPIYLTTFGVKTTQLMCMHIYIVRSGNGLWSSQYLFVRCSLYLHVGLWWLDPTTLGDNIYIYTHTRFQFWMILKDILGKC